MKCQFCGTVNQSDREKCELCNRPLSSSAKNKDNMTMNKNDEKPTNRQPEHLLDLKSSIHPSAHKYNPKETVRETSMNVNNANPDICPECGYELANGVCSSCGYGVKKEEVAGTEQISRVAVNVKQTMRPVRKGEKNNVLTLVPISEETGMPEGEVLSYEGESIVLNRDNTDPKNKTITSQEQAVVTFENGKWFIEDHSEYKTTFVQAARKMELQKGDLILLGTQLYRIEG